MEKYGILYAKSKVYQEKILISHDRWRIWRGMPEGAVHEKAAKDAYLFDITEGEQWFTDQSPIYDAISTGILDCNGKYPCIVAKLPNPIFHYLKIEQTK